MNRWRVVIGGMSMNLALGSLYAWSVFVLPLEKEFGWTRAQTSWVFTIAIVTFALTFILAGRIQDKLGPRPCALIGALLGAGLMVNPPQGYRPAGWTAKATSFSASRDYTPLEMLRTPRFYEMWIAYCLGTTAGLMTISQLVPFARSAGLTAAAATFAITVGAVGNAGGRIFSGWLSDTLRRLTTLRIMI